MLVSCHGGIINSVPSVVALGHHHVPIHHHQLEWHNSPTAQSPACVYKWSHRLKAAALVRQGCGGDRERARGRAVRPGGAGQRHPGQREQHDALPGAQPRRADHVAGGPAPVQDVGGVLVRGWARAAVQGTQRVCAARPGPLQGGSRVPQATQHGGWGLAGSWTACQWVTWLGRLHGTGC